MQEIHCKIIGRVQMVMFRDFVCRKARELDLVGFVKNLDDGSVGVVAQGEKEKLEMLIGKIEQGPYVAEVKKVDTRWGESQGQYDTFDIIY